MTEYQDIPAAQLRAGDELASMTILDVRRATRAEIAALWAGEDHPKVVIAARVRWRDGGETDRYWAGTEPLRVRRGD